MEVITDYISDIEEEPSIQDTFIDSVFLIWGSLLVSNEISLNSLIVNLFNLFSFQEIEYSTVQESIVKPLLKELWVRLLTSNIE